jgi:hypothetical protein
MLLMFFADPWLENSTERTSQIPAVQPQPPQPQLDTLSPPMGESVTPKAERIVATYTIHLCRNGKVFKSIPYVADDGPRPGKGDIPLDGWRIVGVIRQSASEHWVDVEAVQNRAMARPEDPHDKHQ